MLGKIHAGREIYTFYYTPQSVLPAHCFIFMFDFVFS